MKPDHTHLWGPTSSNLLPRLFYHIPLLKPHNFYPITSLLLLISFTAFYTLWLTLFHFLLVVDFPSTHLQNSACSNKLGFSSAQNSTTETDNSNIFSSFINTGFPLLLEHQVRACTTHTHTQSPHTHTHSLVDYVALCTCTIDAATRRRSALSRCSPENFTLCDDSRRHPFLFTPSISSHPSTTDTLGEIAEIYLLFFDLGYLVCSAVIYISLYLPR